MLKFDVITIFPHIFDSYLKESLIEKAIKKKIISFKVHNLRKWAQDKHKTVDDRPYGGGLGMVLKVDVIYKAVEEIKRRNRNIKRRKIILFTPRGKKFNQKLAWRFSKLEQLIMICGRYEGVDERVAKKIANLELSIGNYDLMGGELPALIVLEAVSRLLPGVLGKEELLKERITRERGFIEYPQYTRPAVFIDKKGKKWLVPKILLSGNHQKIKEWKEKRRKVIE